MEYGTVSFKLNNKTHDLFVYVPADRFANTSEYFIPFRDETSGNESYKLARYVDLIPPKNNTLHVRIIAGEKKYK